MDVFLQVNRSVSGALSVTKWPVHGCGEMAKDINTRCNHGYPFPCHIATVCLIEDLRNHQVYIKGFKLRLHTFIQYLRCSCSKSTSRKWPPLPVVFTNQLFRTISLCHLLVNSICSSIARINTHTSSFGHTWVRLWIKWSISCAYFVHPLAQKLSAHIFRTKTTRPESPTFTALVSS